MREGFILGKSDVQILSFLKDILEEYDISNLLYCIGGYSDGSVCIQLSNNEWLVYYGIRLDKEQLSRYPLTCVHSAVLDFLKRLVSLEAFNDVRNKYFEKLFDTYNECYSEKNKRLVLK